MCLPGAREVISAAGPWDIQYSDYPIRGVGRLRESVAVRWRHPQRWCNHRSAETMASMAPIRILIADDSPPIRRHLRRLLETHMQGAVIEEAEDGHQAVEKVIEKAPDIAILDIAMPRLNGLLATEKIATIAPELPIVIHTMYATPQIEGEIRKRGARALVAKDDVQQLVSVISRISEDEIGPSPDWL